MRASLLAAGALAPTRKSLLSYQPARCSEARRPCYFRADLGVVTSAPGFAVVIAGAVRVSIGPGSAVRTPDTSRPAWKAGTLPLPRHPVILPLNILP
ncbi:hypothetical protein DAEQUDRAFT_163949 [Daedalea quercina L-15889]|uniref:Uncharacterized protein n=1 Tax=Daedalea quercina L-15889 TaxID=1314783 RepID=A0A165RH62_9APHY|nr:hypothetical protein DAEQUDRAFT_163949 [Daedalea quercina L-15889]